MSRRDIQARLHDHVYVSYLNYAFFIKGAVIAVASLALVFILGTSGLPFRWARLALWLASVGFSLITIATWSRGSAFTNARANLLDLLLPILIGISELVMYVVLAPVLANLGAQQADSWVYWYAALAAQTFLALQLIRNRWRECVETDYEKELLPTVAKYKGWLQRDSVGALGICIVSTLIFLTTSPHVLPSVKWSVPFNSPITESVHLAIGLLLTAVAFRVVYEATEQYQELADL